MHKKALALTISFCAAAGTFATGAFAQQNTAAPAGAAPSEPAQVDVAPGGEGKPTMSKSISAFFGLGYSYGFSAGIGLGARFQWIFVPDGFLHHLPKTMHDEFGIEPGLDYFHSGYSAGVSGDSVSVDYNELTPLVGVVWNFWLNDKFVVYPKIDIGYRIEFWSVSTTFNGVTTSTGGHSDLFPLYFQGAAGAGYRLGPVTLRAEIGWEALRVGAGMTFF